MWIWNDDVWKYNMYENMWKWYGWNPKGIQVWSWDDLHQRCKNVEYDEMWLNNLFGTKLLKIIAKKGWKCDSRKINIRKVIECFIDVMIMLVQCYEMIWMYCDLW